MTALALTGQEQAALAQHEAVVENGLTTFYAVGEALAAIRDARLYRGNYATFEDYCRGRWGMERRHAYRLMDAAAVRSNVSQGTQALPQYERHARPLTALPPEQQPTVWQRAVETAPQGRMTAAHVERTVAEYRAPSPLAVDMAAALEEDGTYQDSVLRRQYLAAMGSLLKASQQAQDLVRHWSPDEVARLLTEEEASAERHIEPALEWFRRVMEARRSIVTIRRVK